MNPVPFLWLAAVVGFLLLEASTFSMTSVWFAVGAAAALLTCLFTDSFRAQALVFIVECPLRHSRRHSHPRAALPCDRTAQHPAHRGARIDRKPQSVICVLR